MLKQLLVFILTFIIFISGLFCFNYVQATSQSEARGELVELKEKEIKTLEDYEETYGSKAYGVTAYILNKVRIYSIPFSFLGIIIGAIYDYIIGARHLEVKEKGVALMISFVTIAIICQVLPLVFTIVVKFGRE